MKGVFPLLPLTEDELPPLEAPLVDVADGGEQDETALAAAAAVATVAIDAFNR